jgi:hypothetical protein
MRLIAAERAAITLSVAFSSIRATLRAVLPGFEEAYRQHYAEGIQEVAQALDSVALPGQGFVDLVHLVGEEVKP